MSYSRIPLNGMFRITCEFGEEGNWKAGWHTGVDLVNDEQIIYSPAFGIVDKIGFDASYGNYVQILEDDGSHHWLCHLSEVWCSLGETVKPTDKIGKMRSNTEMQLEFIYIMKLEMNQINMLM